MIWHTNKKKKVVNWGRGLLLGQLFGDLLQRAPFGFGYAEDDKHQQGEAHGGVEEHDVREADLLWRIESSGERTISHFVVFRCVTLTMQIMGHNAN